MAEFSIHQHLWNEAWLAATASSRSRKRQVDFCVHQRIVQLLNEHGPKSERPLTLRVYGTMVKGLCVVNNARAKTLLSDCERVVFNFSAHLSSEDSHNPKLPVAKRQRTSAINLELDLSKVLEAETFDWTPAPLEDGALLQIRGVPLVDDIFTSLVQAPMPIEDLQASTGASLLDQAPLLDEAFPPLAAVPEPLMDEEAFAGVVSAPCIQEGALDMLLATTGEKGLPEHANEVAPPLPLTDDGAQQQMVAHGENGGGELVVATSVEERRRRFLRGVPRSPVPGFVFGFDEQHLLSKETYDEWQRSASAISAGYLLPADHAARLPPLPSSDHLGPLRAVVELRFDWQTVSLHDAPHSSLPAPIANGGDWPAETAPTTKVGSRSRSSVQANAVNSVVSKSQHYNELQSKDCSSAITSQLVYVLSSGIADVDDDGDDATMDGDAATCDASTAKVGALLKQAISAAAAAGNGSITLADVVVPPKADRSVAAKSFHALLVLITAGHLTAKQDKPYGPISIGVMEY